jgi:hypothetical protein
MAAADVTTYAGLYGSMADLLEGSYGPYLAEFDSESELAPATLRSLCVNAGNDTPKVYLYMPRGDTRRIKVVHRITRYSPALGVPTEWDNGVYAFGSDVSPGNQITTVVFPAATAFMRTAHTRIPTLAAMADTWQAFPDVLCVGPFDEDDPFTEAARTRFLTPVPKAYIPLVMGKPQWTPRELWAALSSQIAVDGLNGPCAPLLKWIRVASTLTPSNAGVAPPAVVIDPLEVPLADEWLNRRVWSWVSSDLPALATRTGGAAAVMSDSLVAMTMEFSKQREEAAAARIAAKAPKTMAEKYPEATDGLCRICEVTTHLELPPFWAVFASCNKKEGLFALQQALDLRGSQAGSAGQVPVASPVLFERISNFAFHSRNVDDLTSGLSPFLMCAGLGSEANAARNNASVYQMMYSGAAAPAIDQLLPLITAAPHMPSSMLGLLISLQGYSVLLDVLLGVTHRVSVDFRAFLLSWQSLMLDVEGSFGDQIRAWIPRFLRFVQLAMIQYFNTSLVRGANASLPPLHQLIAHVEYRNWQALPPLPSNYVQTPPPPAVGGGAPVAPVAPVRPPAAPPPAPPPAPANTTVTNIQPDRQLMARFERGNVTLRVLTSHAAASPLPTADGSTTQLCLSHALRGVCNSTCRRSSTHRALTSTERSALEALLTRVGIE